jgi:hypothetical protein
VVAVLDVDSVEDVVIEDGGTADGHVDSGDTITIHGTGTLLVKDIVIGDIHTIGPSGPTGITPVMAGITIIN